MNDALRQQIKTDTAAALAEDIGSGDTGDLSAPLVADTVVTAQLFCRDTAILCGVAWFENCFRHLDCNSVFEWTVAEGETMTAPSAPIGRVTARARAVLTAERSAINFLQTLSATATAAHHWQTLAGESVTVVDTRKTIPCLRVAQKYAVRIGGGKNHRHGLYDEILIKENHIAAGGIGAVLTKAFTLTTDKTKVQIEVRDEAELKEAIAAGAVRILLDNFPLPALQKAVAVARAAADKIELEASGGIDETTIAAVAQTGVDRISVGAITKNIRAVDFSLRIQQ